MTDPESRLRELSLKVPSVSLDQRVLEALRGAAAGDAELQPAEAPARKPGSPSGTAGSPRRGSVILAAIVTTVTLTVFVTLMERTIRSSAQPVRDVLAGKNRAAVKLLDSAMSTSRRTGPVDSQIVESSRRGVCGLRISSEERYAEVGDEVAFWQCRLCHSEFDNHCSEHATGVCDCRTCHSAFSADVSRCIAQWHRIEALHTADVTMCLNCHQTEGTSLN